MRVAAWEVVAGDEYQWLDNWYTVAEVTTRGPRVIIETTHKTSDGSPLTFYPTASQSEIVRRND